MVLISMMTCTMSITSMSLSFRVDKLNTEILLSEFKNGLNILIDGEKVPSYLKKKKKKEKST